MYVQPKQVLRVCVSSLDHRDGDFVWAGNVTYVEHLMSKHVAHLLTKYNTSSAKND